MVKLIGRFKWYYWLMVIAVVFLVYIQVSVELEIPDYVSQILALSYSNQDKSLIVDNGLSMLKYALISVVCTVIVGFISAKIASLFSRDLRRDIYKKIQGFQLEEMDNFKTPSLITRSTNDINQVQMVIIMVLRIAIMAPLNAIKSIAKASNKANEMSFLIVIAVITLVLIVATIFIVVLPRFKRVQKLTDRLNLVTRENLTGLRVIRAFNAFDTQKEKFEVVNQDITKNNLFINRSTNLMMPLMILLMNSISLSIIYIGAKLVNESKMNLADVFAFQQYAMIIIMSFMMFTMLSIMIPRGVVSGNRIYEVLNTSPTIIDSDEDCQLEGHSIEFKNVSFSYPGGSDLVLEDISFKVKKGQTLALIGGTGSGKTTILNLLLRFYDTTRGEILIDDRNIRDIKLKQLHDLIGYVPQKGFLFSGTIESNLKYGSKDASVEQMEKALEIALAKDFVDSLDGKLQYKISQSGKNVSGGERQRLCIARALIKNPPFLVFDDSFSALDFKTDKMVRQRIIENTKDVTKIIVAQRIGTIIDADKIVVLNEGKVVQVGTHKELLETCDIYKEIAYSQLSKEEL